MKMRHKREQDHDEDERQAVSGKEKTRLNYFNVSGKAAPAEDELVLPYPQEPPMRSMTHPSPKEPAFECPLPADGTMSDLWSVSWIMSELVAGFETLAHLPPTVTIFGSVRAKPGDAAYIAAVETARLLAQAGFGIMTGGGPGIMEAANKGAQEGGSTSIGCMIELQAREPANSYLDISLGFRYFLVRKTMLIKHACAFVVFPGGFGTLDELFEVLTLVQNKKVSSCPIILYDSKYWGRLVKWIRQTMLASDKIGLQDADLLHLSDDPYQICQLVLTTAQQRNRQGEIHLRHPRERGVQELEVEVRRNASSSNWHAGSQEAGHQG